MKKKAIVIVAVLAVVVLGTLLYLFNTRTRLTLVNFPEDVVAEFIAANKNPLITIEYRNPKKDDLTGIEGSNLILLFHARGFSSQQSENLKRATESGSKLLFFASTSKEFNTNALASADSLYLTQCLENGGRKNQENLLNYARAKVHGQKIWVASIEPPEDFPDDVFYRLGTDFYTEDAKKYWEEYKKQGLYKDGKPIIAIMNLGVGFSTVHRSYQDSMILNLEGRGYNVVAIAGFMKRFDMIKAIKPNMVMYFAHGRLEFRRSREMVQYLAQNNILVMLPQVMHETISDWQKSQQGLDPGLVGQNVVMPEIDGAIAPYAVAAQVMTDNNLLIARPIPGRVGRFCELADRWLKLRTIPNSEKKLCIFYYKGAGKNAIAAEGLEVLPSMLQLLDRLKSQGYNTGNRHPKSVAELKQLIQTEGPLLGDYAQGSIEKFIVEAKPILISKPELEAWMKADLTPEAITDVKKLYGEAPGNYLTTTRNDTSFVAVPSVRLGNVTLLPVLPAALDQNEFQYTHGAKKAPPYAYIASYLSVRHTFNADVVMHFGTHGSIEFTPFKQVGLGSDDWADALIGAMPHAYLYTINNIGEAMMAKRRSYATMTSHLTPPYDEAETYNDLKALDEDLGKYAHASDAVKQALKKTIRSFVDSLKLGKDLSLTDKQLVDMDDATLETITQYVNHLKHEKISIGLHTLGVPYSKFEFGSTIRMMAVNPLAKALTDGLLLNSPRMKKYLAEEKGNIEAKRLIEGVLTNLPIDSQYFKFNGINSGSLQKLTQINRAIYQTLNQVKQNSVNLTNSPMAELAGTEKIANGSYMPVSSGGDAVFNPMALPTGRNLYTINPDVTPSVETWEAGKVLADLILQKHIAKHGDYPKKLAYTLWGSEFIRDEGLGVAQVLYLMGVRPLRNQRGSVYDIELIPMVELKRPRIDVLVQTSGQFRDVGGSRIALINKAAALAAAATDNGEYKNFVQEGRTTAVADLKQKGLAPAMAEKLADVRVFGGVNGNYGTGIMGLVEKGDQWETDKDIADRYIKNMGATYSDDFWADYQVGVFEVMLKNTEAVVHPRSSHQTGPISLDHVYEFMGGLSASIRVVTGKDPDGYFHDSRNKFNPTVQNLKEAIWVETRTNLLNPKFVKAQMNEGETAAENFAEKFRDTYGWNVMKPDAIDPEIWQGYYDMYVSDNLNLGTVDFFKQKNPFALQEMTAVMLETIRKGYWKPSDRVIGKIAELHTSLVGQYSAGCSGFVCDNNKLSKFIAQNINGQLKSEYLKKLEEVKSGSANGGKDGIVMEKQKNKTEHVEINKLASGNNWIKWVLIVIGIVVVVVALKRFKLF